MVNYLTICASITEAVNQYLVHIPVLVTENLLFSNRQERVKRFDERMCKTRGSISGLLAAEAYHATDRFFGKVKLHVGQKIVVRNVQKPVHSHLKNEKKQRVATPCKTCNYMFYFFLSFLFCFTTTNE